MDALKPRLRIPSLRAALLRLHADLFQINTFVPSEIWYSIGPLTLLEKLTIVLEDRRFLRHNGIDVKSCIREVVRALTFRRHGGASTIDMQFVRTATGYRDKHLRRKLYEMLLAVLLQFRYSKIIILRSYLAHAFFGSGLIGASRASTRLFGKAAEELNIQEASLLAAMLVYPRPLRPSTGWELKVKRRAEYGQRIYARTEKRLEKLPR